MVSKNQLPYINEIHYVGADANNRVEVAVGADDTNVYVIRLYNNNVYDADYRSDNTFFVMTSAPVNGIKYIVYTVPIACYGPWCSIYLYTAPGGIFLEQLSYEGALNIYETDIGVLEDDNGPSSFSLQRQIGSTTWDPPKLSTFGAANVVPTRAPTKMPTRTPTKMPTQKPTNRPVKEPTKAPVKVNTTAPVAVPTDAPVRKPCGFLNLSIFCPLTGCGVIGRAIGLCN